MEFFNCRTKSFHRNNGFNQIVAVEYNKLKNALGGISFLTMDGIGSLGLFSLINKSPAFVALVGDKSNHIAGHRMDYARDLTSFGVSVIKTLEKFNILIDVGRLNKKSLHSAMKIITKPFVLTDVVLSSFCEKFALSEGEEQLAIEKGALLVVNIDDFNIHSLSRAIKCFISRYGGAGLAISSWRNSERKVKKLIGLLLEDSVSYQDIEAVIKGNAEKFFSFGREVPNLKFLVDKTGYL